MDVNQTGIFYMGAMPGGVREFPRQYRGGFARNLDKKFVLILAGCAVVLGTLTFTLSLVPPTDTPSDKEILRIQERYAQLVLNQPRKVVREAPEKPAASPTDEKAAEKEDAGPVADGAKETFEERQKRKEDQREDRRRKREMVSEQVRSSGIFAAITSTSSGPGGAAAGVGDLLAGAGGVGDLGSVNLSRGTFASRDVGAQDLGGRRGAQTSGVGIEKSSVGTASGAQIASSGQVNITTAPPEMKSESGEAVSTSRACIQKIINRESHRIRRVYENWLKRDPNLAGQLRVRFVILPSGSVANAGVVTSTTNNQEFDENILRYIRRWVFSDCNIGESIEIVFPFAFSGTQ